MKQPKRKQQRGQRRGGKYPKRPVITTRDPATRGAFYRATDQDAPLGKYQLAVGAVRHPETGLWQVWLSTNGLDILCLAAFREEQKAINAVTIIQREGRTSHFGNQEIVNELFEFLAEESDDTPQLLPDELVRRLVRDIVHSVIETPSDTAGR